VSLRTVLPGLIRNKGIWLIALTLLFRMAGITGMTGYLPIYLVENRGWPEASADSTLAVFYAVSTISVIPIATLSDRIGIRKAILVSGLVVMTASLTLIAFTGGPIIWVYMIASGVFMDSFMAIIVTMLMESEGVGIEHAGTALGLVFTIAPIGAAVAAPVGNSLARISPGLPFIFWAGLSVIALGTIAFTKETGWRKKKSLANKVGGQAVQ
jgi:predicted MFS family arabinose efflux permease